MTFNFQGVFGVTLPEEIKFEWASICGFVNDPQRTSIGKLEHQRFPVAMLKAYGFSMGDYSDPINLVRELRSAIASLGRADRSRKRREFWVVIDDRDLKSPVVSPPSSDGVIGLCREILRNFNLDHLKLDPFEMVSILLERYYHGTWRARRDAESFEAYCRGYFTKIGRLRAGAVQKKPSRRRYRKPVSIAGAC